MLSPFLESYDVAGICPASFSFDLMTKHLISLPMERGLVLKWSPICLYDHPCFLKAIASLRRLDLQPFAEPRKRENLSSCMLIKSIFKCYQVSRVWLIEWYSLFYRIIQPGCFFRVKCLSNCRANCCRCWAGSAKWYVACQWMFRIAWWME